MLAPRKLSDIPPEEILRLYPCMDMDKWILDKVLEGPLELAEECGVSIPRFSSKIGHCYPLLIQVAMDGKDVTMHAGTENFESAKSAGQMIRKNEVVTWRITCGEHVGFGRSFPEAVCKLAICKKFDIRGGQYEKRNSLV